MPRLSAGLVCLVLAGVAGIQPAGASDPWTKLQRSFHLPRVARGARCPVSAVDRRVGWSRIHIFGGSGTGRGPVYPGLGGSGGVLHVDPDTVYGGPWAGGKLFWYVKRSYRGRVLIRGRRLDDAGTLEFNGDRVPASGELRIEPWDTVPWEGQPYRSRGVASTVRVQSSGCYGVQIDGTSFSRVVVFAVSGA
jgi:hypothetical protein